MARHTLRHHHEHPHSDSSESFAGLNDSILEGMGHTRDVLLSRITAFQQETLNFVNHRLERDADLVREYRQCRTIMDVMAVQQKWLAHMGEDYLREWVKLTQAMGSAASNAERESEGERTHRESAHAQEAREHHAAA
jgi:hypothetical protein